MTPVHVGLVGLFIVGLAIFTGALVQGCIGFGAIVTAFSVVVLVEPELLPQSVIISTTPVVVAVFLQNRGSVRWGEALRLIGGRAPGVALGAFLVSRLSPVFLAYVGATVVLVAVLVTANIPPITRNTPTLLTAGFASGLFGTATGIGGPPLGLMYQHGAGVDLRATVGTVMLVGGAMTISGFALAGELEAVDIRTGLALMPFSLAGVLTARAIHTWVDDRITRVVQIVSVAGAVLAIIRLSL